MNNRNTGFVMIAFLASVAGVIVSALLLKEDVLSTAHTLFEYFPQHFGVTPSSTWSGALFLGAFITVAQVVSASVAFNKFFGIPWRIVSGVILVASVIFDAWTDICYRSGNFSGNMVVATVTTIAFYTFGSEIMQSLSWLIVGSTWRRGIREIMRAGAEVKAGIGTIGAEWVMLLRQAGNNEQRRLSGQQPQSQRPYQQPSSAPTVPRPYTTTPINQPILKPASSIARPAPKPSAGVRSNVPEPTYHPIGMQVSDRNSHYDA